MSIYAYTVLMRKSRESYAVSLKSTLGVHDIVELLENADIQAWLQAER